MRFSRTPIVAAAAVVVLSGCGGGGEASDPEPIIPSSSSADPSPSEPSESEGAGEAPVMPEAAKERSDDGVRAFLDHWAQVVTYSQNSGDAQALEDISADGCESCRASSDLVTEVYGGGGMMSSAGWRTTQVVFGPDRDQPLAKFRRGVETLSRADEPQERFPAETVTVQFELTWRAGQWLVRQFTFRA